MMHLTTTWTTRLCYLARGDLALLRRGVRQVADGRIPRRDAPECALRMARRPGDAVRPRGTDTEACVSGELPVDQYARGPLARE